MRIRPCLRTTAKGALIYIATIAAVIAVHSIALYLDGATENEPRTQAFTQLQA